MGSSLHSPKCAIVKWSLISERWNPSQLRCNCSRHPGWVCHKRLIKSWGSRVWEDESGVNDVWRRADAWWLSMRMDEAWESACVISLSFPQNTLRELDPFASSAPRCEWIKVTDTCEAILAAWAFLNQTTINIYMNAPLLCVILCFVRGGFSFAGLGWPHLTGTKEAWARMLGADKGSVGVWSPQIRRQVEAGRGTLTVANLQEDFGFDSVQCLGLWLQTCFACVGWVLETFICVPRYYKKTSFLWG